MCMLLEVFKYAKLRKCSISPVKVMLYIFLYAKWPANYILMSWAYLNILKQNFLFRVYKCNWHICILKTSPFNIHFRSFVEALTGPAACSNAPQSIYPYSRNEMCQIHFYSLILCIMFDKEFFASILWFIWKSAYYIMMGKHKQVVAKFTKVEKLKITLKLLWLYVNLQGPYTNHSLWYRCQTEQW